MENTEFEGMPTPVENILKVEATIRFVSKFAIYLSGSYGVYELAMRLFEDNPYTAKQLSLSVVGITLGNLFNRAADKLDVGIMASE